MEKSSHDGTDPTPDATPARPEPPPLPVLAHAPEVEPLHNLAEIRTIFWQNVVREMLVTLPSLAAVHPEVLDGRMAVLTRAGERIPIASVEPLFLCSILAPDAQQLCNAVQGTVFNIRTPNGEVFTIPLQEVRAVHCLSNELLRELEALARSMGDDDGSSEPFGFAAFRSLRKQGRRNNAGAAEDDAPERTE